MKVIEIEQNCQFFIPPRKHIIMFYLQGKGKTVIVGTTAFYESTKEQRKWCSKVIRKVHGTLFNF